MKQLDSRTLQYIAEAYGKKYAEGDEVQQDQPSLQLDAGTYDPDKAALSLLANPQLGDQAKETVAKDKGLNLTADQINTSIPQEDNRVADVAPSDKAPISEQKNSTATQNVPLSKKESDFKKAGVPDIEASLQEEKAANTESANAQAKQGKEEVAALKTGNDAIAALPSANDIAQSYKSKDDTLLKAYQSKTIDPNHYWNSKTTGQKIIAGIGMLLGGGGSQTASFIENAINRDIDAQKNDQSQTMNLWKMNKEEYGNDLAANLATQNQLLLGTQNQLQQAAANAKGPIAIAAANHGNALIDQKLAENRFKLSLMQPTSDSFGIDPAKKVTWLVPPEKQQKVFDEIDAAQNTTRNAPDILKAFDNAASKLHAVDFVPGMQNADQKAYHALLGPTFKDVEGTVRQAAMDNMFNNTTPQFGDDARTLGIKRNAVIDYMTAKSSAPTASGFGINLNQYPSTNTRASIAPAPGHKPSGPEIKTMNGVQYQQVQGGWKKVQGGWKKVQ